MHEVADRLLAVLARDGATLAVAESLTGGAVCDALVSVPGASRVLLGGVVAYATALKARLLDVDGELLATVGAVDPQVALAMARGVRHRLGADVGLATTGVAGPDAQDGQPVGTVYVAIATGSGQRVRRLALHGDRATIRHAAVAAVLELALEVLGPAVGGDPNHPTGGS